MAATGESSDRPRSRESEDQGTTPRPPKKRFLASASSSPTPSVDGDHDSSLEESADSVEDPLEIFRKDAIARQWKEYMRLGKRWKRRTQTAQDLCKTSEHSLNTWDAHFQQFSNVLKEVFSQTNAECVKESLKRKSDNVLSSSTMSEWASENAGNLSGALGTAQPLPADMELLVQGWRSLRGSVGDKVKPLLGDDDALIKDYSEALNEWNSSTAALLDAKNSFYTANAKKFVLMEELSLLSKRIQITEETMRDLRIELVNAENRLSSCNNKSSEKGASGETDKAKTESERLESNLPAHGGIADSLQEAIVRAKSALDEQLREIEVIKDQRIDLKQQIVRVEMDLVLLPEERIYKTHPIRELYQAREYHRDKSRHLASICNKLQRDIEDMQRDRRQLLRELDSEQIASINELQSKLRSLDQELTSIRGERDALQTSMEEYKVYGGYKRASTQELRAIAEARKERASLLKMEYSRLERKRAASTGVSIFYESIMKNEDIDASITNMEQEIALMEKQLQDQLAQSGNEDDKENKLKVVMNLSRIQRALAEFKEKYGFDASMSDENEAIKVLEARVADQASKIADTRQKIQNMETMENQLLGEIETVGRAYVDLEGRNIKKLEDLLQMETEVSILQGERSRYSQAFTSLNKSKDAHGMVATALGKQVEKELTYVKEFNEREKNINSQLVILDREIGASKAALQLYEQRETELKEALKELKDKTAAAKDRARQMEKAILERIALVEQGAHERLRLEENSELLRRKLQASTKVEKPAEMKLRKEKEEYRALLNCSSCRIHLKSHVLMRCMHTFCKGCLDTRIETRQRRCPSCNESFGINDVRQFYF